MAALMKQRVVLVYTHDSIGLGEDGPTHQPVEHVASLRIRAERARLAALRHGRDRRGLGGLDRAPRRADVPDPEPAALPAMPRSAAQLAEVARGGYVLVDCGSAPECILIATGSEVGLAVDSARRLAEAGRRVRVVSMPCTSVFDAQPQAYRDSVLPPGVRGSRSRRASATAGGATSGRAGP